MPKAAPKLGINLDLLHPQSNPEKLTVRIFKWLLSTGRFIFVFVEAIVLLAFVARFKLDADLQTQKEAIEEQIPYIESLKPYEILIKQTQLKIATITAFKKSSPDYPQLLRKIANQTPSGVKITSLALDKAVGKVNLHINGQAQTNNDVSSLVSNLTSDKTFSEVSLASLGLENQVIQFTIEASSNINQPSQSL